MLRILAALLALIAAPAAAAVSDTVEGHALTARLLSVENGVAPGDATVAAGLHLRLSDGWKSYWRSPGEVGLPPTLSWEGSENVAAVEMAFPAPERFEAFDIQNFGYSGEVLHPLTVVLEEPGAPARLRLVADLLVCAEICVPETLSLSLDLPAGAGFDAASAATLADWIARVPGTGEEAGIALGAVHLDEAALTLAATAETPFAAPDLFVEQGAGAAFDRPEIVLGDGGRRLWARVPVLAPGEGPLDVTLVDGARAATMRAAPADAAPPRPAGGGTGLWAMLLVALLGGLILNVMPCVLPVLSIKLASALQARDKGLARVRAGFLASAAGVVAFFLALAAILAGLRMAGVAIGWGVQFQNPVFLALMIGLMVLFAANMLGFFAVDLGQGAMTGIARAGPRDGLRGDFATGAFAAVMATPCSAPFIGTAVTYALTHGPARILAIFAAMGLGLALPYLLVAARPGLVSRLPRPGRWMRLVQRLLGGLLLLTALWLLSVLLAAAGPLPAALVGGLAVLLLAALALRRRARVVGGAGLAAMLAAALLVPAGAAGTDVDAGWEVFARDRIAAAVAEGDVVFVDVTADWCLTCQANKRLVLRDADVAAALGEAVAMQADWTRPDPAIADYLRANGRFGIPFNAVYGPGAPEGIVLPELLSEAAVLDAISRAAAPG